MGALFAVASAAVLIGIALTRRGSLPRLPWLEAWWFHAAVTWPIVMKATFGLCVFAGALADQSANYNLIVYGPAVAAGALVFCWRLSDRYRRVFGPGVLVVLSLMFAMPYAIWGNHAPLSMGLSLGMTLPLLLRSQTRIPFAAWTRTAGSAIFTIALSAVATAVVSPSNIIGVCRDDKCSIWGETLISPVTNNGNFLGVALAILLPIAIVRIRPLSAILLTTGTVVFIEVSGRADRHSLLRLLF